MNIELAKNNISMVCIGNASQKTRNVQHAHLSCLGEHVAKGQKREKNRSEQIRRTRNYCLFPLDYIRQLFCRHGSATSQPQPRPNRQRPGLQPGKLQMVYPDRAISEFSRRTKAGSSEAHVESLQGQEFKALQGLRGLISRSSVKKQKNRALQRVQSIDGNRHWRYIV